MKKKFIPIVSVFAPDGTLHLKGVVEYARNNGTDQLPNWIVTVLLVDGSRWHVRQVQDGFARHRFVFEMKKEK